MGQRNNKSSRRIHNEMKAIQKRAERTGEPIRGKDASRFRKQSSLYQSAVVGESYDRQYEDA